MSEFWESTLPPEALYCPQADSYVHGETIAAGDVGVLEQVAGSLENAGPDFAGEPLLDWSLDASWRASDPFGMIFLQLRNVGIDNANIGIGAPVRDGTSARLGWAFESGEPFAGVRVTEPSGFGFLDGNSAGRLAVGLQLPSILTGRLGAVEGSLFANLSAGRVGAAVSVRLLVIGAAGEASVGWGRGFELLANYLGAEAFHIIEFPYRYVEGFDLPR